MGNKLMNAINNVNGFYYVVEIIGSNERRVSQNFAFMADAEEAKRRMKRLDNGVYAVRAA